MVRKLAVMKEQLWTHLFRMLLVETMLVVCWASVTNWLIDLNAVPLFLNIVNRKISCKEISYFLLLLISIIYIYLSVMQMLYSWKIVNERKEEIMPLIHDIKLPLTIVKGNTELIIDNSTDMYSISHLENVVEATEKIERYIMLLMDCINVEELKEQPKEFVECERLSQQIKTGVEKYTVNLGEVIEVIINPVSGYLLVDYLSLERAIFNLVDNAIEYRLKDEKIVCYVEKKGKNFSIQLCNRDGCFNDDVLLNGKKFFYTTNEKKDLPHYGIGLAYAQKVVQKHGGYLDVYNSEELGAVVRIDLPTYEEIRN